MLFDPKTLQSQRRHYNLEESCDYHGYSGIRISWCRNPSFFFLQSLQSNPHDFWHGWYETRFQSKREDSFPPHGPERKIHPGSFSRSEKCFMALFNRSLKLFPLSFSSPPYNIAKKEYRALLTADLEFSCLLFDNSTNTGGRAPKIFEDSIGNLEFVSGDHGPEQYNITFSGDVNRGNSVFTPPPPLAISGCIGITVRNPCEYAFWGDQ